MLHSSLPLKSSYMMTLLSPEERVFAANLINLPGSVPRAAATTIGGYLMENVSTTLPIYAAAIIFSLKLVIISLFSIKLNHQKRDLIIKPQY